MSKEIYESTASSRSPKLRTPSPRSPKTRSRYASPLRRDSPEFPKIPSSGLIKGKLSSPSPASVQELKNLYCCNIPSDLMNRDLLRDHFSQFGQVLRLYLSYKKNSCSVHFKTHEAAKRGKLEGVSFKGHSIHIFWSKPATRSEKRIVATVEGAEEKQEIKDTSSNSDEDRSGEILQQPHVVDTKTVGSEEENVIEESQDIREKDIDLHSKKYEVSEEVAEELQAMLESCEYDILEADADETCRSKQRFAGSLPLDPPVRRSRRRFPMAVDTTSRLQDLLDMWKEESRNRFLIAKHRYEILKLHDKILRIARGKQSDLSKVEVTKGTCQDMCPEKERYQREAHQKVAYYELLGTSKGKVQMNHAIAVKQYSRSSADQEEPLPRELRPTPVLRMTMDYLLANIMDKCEDKNENLGEWYHFLWDRTRGIRKEITQQELCDKDSVNLVEECVRFHIHCSARLVAEKTSVFDSKINSEHLTKCLQTLKYMYHDMSLKGITCENEAEFRGYMILLNLNDTNFLWELKELREVIINSKPVQFAMDVHTALNTNNYIKFFKLLKATIYLNACILLRYFYQIRLKALHIIYKSYVSGGKQAVLTLGEFKRLLCFESLKEAINFCNHHGMNLNGNENEMISKVPVKCPFTNLPVSRAIHLIESKRRTSIAETINGGPLKTESFQNHQPYSSFLPNGMLREEVINRINDVVENSPSKQKSKDKEQNSDNTPLVHFKTSEEKTDSSLVPFRESEEDSSSVNMRATERQYISPLLRSESPKGIHTSPIHLSEKPEGLHTMPLLRLGTPEGLHTSPSHHSGTPQGVHASPLLRSGTPEGIHTLPPDHSGTPQGVHTSPLLHLGTPEGVHSSPLHHFETSRKVFNPPSSQLRIPKRRHLSPLLRPETPEASPLFGFETSKDIHKLPQVLNLPKEENKTEANTQQSKHMMDIAIMQAENEKCCQLLTVMVDEVIKEEFQVFCERLDNVAILDLDEILLDVMCNMTRDVFKEVVAEEEENIRRKEGICVEAEISFKKEMIKREEEERIRIEEERKCKEEERKLKEEERKHKEEEEKKRKAEEERERKLLDETVNEVTEAILEETQKEMIYDIANFETTLHNNSVEEMNLIAEEIIHEIVETIVDREMLKSKLEYLSVRRVQYCEKTYFNLWRKNIWRSKEKKRSMKDFPAWFAPLTAQQQVALLGKPPPGTGIKLKPLEIPSRREEIIEPLNFCDIVALNLIVHSTNRSATSKYFKLVVSLPDEVESPDYSKYCQNIVEIAFPETKNLNMKSPPHFLKRMTEPNVYNLTVSLRILLGHLMYERGIANDFALSGMNGLIFLMCQKAEEIHLARQRLYKCITNRKHYGVIHIAIIISKKFYESSANPEYVIKSLCEETTARFNVKFFLKEQGPYEFTSVFLRAINWLSSVHESVASPYCCTAYFMMKATLSVHLWERFILAEALPRDNLDKIKLNLFIAVKIYNRACKELCALVTDEEMNSYIIGAPEFAPRHPKYERTAAGYIVMPEYFGSPQYKEMLVELFKNAEIAMPCQQNLRSKEDLDVLLLNLCKENKISEKTHQEILGFVNFKLRDISVEPDSHTWIVEAMNSFSWATILKYMVVDKLETLNFIDKLQTEFDDCPIVVAANREKLYNFVIAQWNTFVRTGDQAASKLSFTLRDQFSQELYHQTMIFNSLNRQSRSMKRKTSLQDFRIVKRFKECELSEFESLLNISVDISQQQKEAYLKCKEEIINLSNAVKDYSKKQECLREKLVNFLEISE